MKARKAIQKIALENGVSEKEVRDEIQKAIDEGMNSTDPQVIKLWKKIPRKGEKPTPEEFIDHISGKIRREL